MLDDVGLTGKRHMKSETLSGGMKRKLCVAIALVGDSQASTSVDECKECIKTEKNINSTVSQACHFGIHHRGNVPGLRRIYATIAFFE